MAKLGSKLDIGSKAVTKRAKQQSPKSSPKQDSQQARPTQLPA